MSAGVGATPSLHAMDRIEAETAPLLTQLSCFDSQLLTEFQNSYLSTELQSLLQGSHLPTQESCSGTSYLVPRTSSSGCRAPVSTDLPVGACTDCYQPDVEDSEGLSVSKKTQREHKVIGVTPVRGRSSKYRRAPGLKDKEG